MWEQAYNVAEEEYEREMQTEVGGISGVHYEEFGDIEWVEGKTEFLDEIQRVVTCYGFGFGFDMNTVFESVQEELENAPYYRVNEMVEELGIELEKGFVGFD
jgi:phage terminase large subunit